MSALRSAQEFRDLGLFTEALKMLTAGPLPRDESTDGDALKAELLERTGSYAQARALVGTLQKRPNLSLANRSECEVVLALLDWDALKIDSALAHFQKSISIAKEASDLSGI